VGDEESEPDIRRIPAIVLLLNILRLGEMGVCGRSASLDVVDEVRDGPALAGAGYSWKLVGVYT
jgi:hypothetical protein